MTSPQTWRYRGGEFDLTRKTLVMGILNVTPDSFSDGGRFPNADAALSHAGRMLAEGADIIDVGGESSRPGAEPVPESGELSRILPVIEALAGTPGVVISVDTTKSGVAERALCAGAHIINDISGLTGDPAMAAVVQRHGAGLVIMHMKGTPATMQDDPRYADVVDEVGRFLRGQVDAALAAGIAAEQIVVDPGIGFGKTTGHNLALLAHTGRLAALTGRPLLIGASRKRFLGAVTGREVHDRLPGSLAAAAYVIARGARIIRVHEVKESCDVARMIDRLQSSAG